MPKPHRKYKALRRKGYSKAKAARITIAGRRRRRKR